MEEEIRIGVFICHCGVNIASVIDVEEIMEYSKTLNNVVAVDTNLFTCSSLGQSTIIDTIRDTKLNRVVIAACSPKMHENTFRKTVEEGGLNPHLLELVNIREQSSWVHSDNPRGATEKAKTLIRMGVAKARLLEPIEKTKIKVTEKVLVIGGGVAGLRSSLGAADRGTQVTLVERNPTLGGNAIRIGDLVNSDKKGSQIVNDLIDRVKDNDNITIFTNSTINEVKGAYGDYKVQIVKGPRYVLDTCRNPEKGEEVCPEEVMNEYEFNLDTRKAIFKPFENAFPNSYTIDMKVCTKCNLCVDVCDPGTIDLTLEPEIIHDEFGTIITAIGYDPYEPAIGEFGYRENPRVMTLLQLERLLDENTSIKDNLRMSKDPDNIVFISCVGSMQDPNIEGSNTYCSRMCCSASFKNMIRLREKFPEANIFYLYRDIRTYARREERLYEEASDKQILFMRYELEYPPTVDVNGGVNVEVYDKLIREQLSIPTDILVLAQGMVPTKGYKVIAELLKLPCTSEGWISEAHAKLRPVEISSPGVYVAGTAQGPKDISESVISASAATLKAIIPIVQGEVELEPLVSYVNEDVCGTCGICVSTCPYNAVSQIDIDGGRKVAYVEAKLCAGCGQCVAACPSGAMQQKSFKDHQMYSMINEVVQ